MDERHSTEAGIRRAKQLVTTATEAARALERAKQAVDDLADTQGALEEIAAIAYAIERSLTRARIAADGCASIDNMAQLIVRNIEDEVVEALKLRAARHGRSAEAEHREILREALLKRQSVSLKQRLLAMSGLGQDARCEVDS